MKYFDSLADITNEKLFEGDFTMTDEQFERLARRHIDTVHRVPVLLYYYEGYSTAEISELLGIPTPTVATRLSRGREVDAAKKSSTI